MEHRPLWKQRVMAHMRQFKDAIPLQPIMELCGDRRILVENHQGIKRYSPEQIAISVRFGQITICGTGLHINKMEGQMLVITGLIESIFVERGRE